MYLDLSWFIHRYHQALVGACHLKLSSEDLSAINVVLSKSEGVAGEVYELERCMTGCHGSIMKCNLNQVNQASHLEELCERCLLLFGIQKEISSLFSQVC